VQIQVRTGDGTKRFISLSRMIDGKALKIESRGDGPIVVTRTERGKTITRKFKNADEMCKQDAEAYKLYKNVRTATQAKTAASQGASDTGPVVVIWPETMLPPGINLDAKEAAAKAKAAAEHARKEAEAKRKQIEIQLKARQKAHEHEARERHHRHVEEQFEARRKAYERMHEQRLKQLDQMRARMREQFERALKSIEEQIKREQQRHRAAMEQLERMQEGPK
jgi:hypothetical protein